MVQRSQPLVTIGGPLYCHVPDVVPIVPISGLSLLMPAYNSPGDDFIYEVRYYKWAPYGSPRTTPACDIQYYSARSGAWCRCETKPAGHVHFRLMISQFSPTKQVSQLFRKFH